MIYTLEYQSLLRSQGGLFNGWALQQEAEPAEWYSRLPTMEALGMVQAIPQISTMITEEGKDGARSQYEYLGRYSAILGLRNCMSGVARAWGYLQSGSKAVAGIFKDSFKQLGDILRNVSEILENSPLAMALDALVAIPIVGWIIYIIKEIVKAIFRIYGKIKEKESADERATAAELTAEYALPMWDFVPEFDTSMGRLLQEQLSPLHYDAEWMMLPANPAVNAGDFFAEKMKAEPGAQTCTDAWAIMSSNEELPGGLGFMPGTMNIHSTVGLRPKSTYGGPIDLGTYMPVTGSMAATIWGQLVKGDSSMMFAIRPDYVKGQWQNYMEAAFGFALDELSKGWSCVAGKTSFGDTTYECGRCDRDFSNCDKDGKMRSIPTSSAEAHEFGYLYYLQQIFGLPAISSTRDLPYVDPSKIDLDDSYIGKALDNLYQRQKDTIDSIKCMYLDDGSVDAEGGIESSRRYQAIRPGTDLHSQWIENVQAVFDSGDWKRVNYLDVIKGSKIDQSIHQACANMGTTPDEFFQMKSPTRFERGLAKKGMATTAGPSVLGDPKPPPPHDPIDLERLPDIGGGRPKSGLGGLLALGALGVGGYYAYKKFVK